LGKLEIVSKHFALWAPYFHTICAFSKFPLVLIFLSFIDPERGGFGVIFPEVMILPEWLCPEENIITDGNIAESPERRVYK
jgi:hypothetical protein